jgi:hypothetical protein
MTRYPLSETSKPKSITYVEETILSIKKEKAFVPAELKAFGVDSLRTHTSIVN